MIELVLTDIGNGAQVRHEIGIKYEERQTTTKNDKRLQVTKCRFENTWCYQRRKSRGRTRLEERATREGCTVQILSDKSRELGVSEEREGPLGKVVQIVENRKRGGG